MILSKESYCQITLALKDKLIKSQDRSMFYTEQNKDTEMIDFFENDIKEILKALKDIENIYFDREINK